MTLPPATRATLRAMLLSAIRHLLAGAGAALVTRGLVTQDQLAGVIPDVAELIVGGLLFAVAAGAGQARAWLAHSPARLAAAWRALRAPQA